MPLSWLCLTSHTRTLQNVLLPSLRIITFPHAQRLASSPYQVSYIVHQRFGQTLPALLFLSRLRSSRNKTATISSCVLRSHAREHVLACAETNKQRKGNKPDTESEIRAYFGEGRVVRRVVCVPVIRGIGSISRRGLEMGEP